MSIKLVSKFVSRQAFAIALVPFISGCEQQYNLSQGDLTQQVERTIEINSESKDFIPVVKIPLIVDNSASMEDEQLLLAQNSLSLADAVKGKNVEFTVLTSSALDNATAAMKATQTTKTVFEWLSTGGQSTVFPTAPKASDGQNYPSYSKRSMNLLNPSLNGTPIVFRYNMSDADFAAKRQELYQTIVKVGTDGSDDEAGLCAIGRTLSESDGVNKIFTRGDKAAFVVISDANDFSISSLCTREISNQKYKFVSKAQPPVTVTVEDSVNPGWWEYKMGYKNPDKYSLGYTYENGSNYTVKSNYEVYKLFAVYDNPQYKVVAHYQTPVYTVASSYIKASYRVSYDYEYESTCPGRDSSTVPCTKKGSVANATYPGSSTSPVSGDCSGEVLTYVKGLLSTGQTLSSCTFSNKQTTSSVTKVFDPATYGHPVSGSGNLACNASLVTLAKSMVPSGSTYSNCSYTYVANDALAAAKVFDPAAYGNPASGSGSLSCNNSLETLAKSQVPANGVYSGCHYTYSANQATASSAFDPASYGNPPSGSGNLTCNSSLESFAKKSLVPAGKSYVSCYYNYSTASATASFNPASYGNPALGTNLACNTALVAYAKTLVPSGNRYSSCLYTGTAAKASGTLALSSDPGSLANGASCMGRTDLVAQIQAKQPGKKISTCTYSVTQGSVASTCTMDDEQNLTRNICDGQSFSYGGKTFANLDAYYRANPSKCNAALTATLTTQGCTSRKGYSKQITQPDPVSNYAVDSTTSLSVIDAMKAGLTVSGSDFNSAITAKANDLFGSNGYFISTIIAHKQAGNCTPSPDSAGVGGEKYYQLANSRPDGLKAITPICANSYAPALTGIGDFVQKVALSSYRVPLLDGEQISAVNIRRGSSMVTLQASKDYTVTGNSVDFSSGVVQPKDIIVISVFKVTVVKKGL